MKAAKTRSLPLALFLTGGLVLAAVMLRKRRRMDFRDASVLITGGSRGLGLEMSRIFAREGARLSLLARDAGELERARRELSDLGGDVQVYPCDIRDGNAAAAVAAQIIAERGRLDVLINNAGVIQVGAFENATFEDFREMIDLFVWGPLSLVKAVLPIMKKQGSGRIVNIASIGGVVSVPHLVSYDTGKSALIGFSDGIRAELAKDNILVTTVIPGLMRTGSHVNARYKGQYRKEYAWFAGLEGMPFLSMNAEQAARKIVEACRYGDPSLVLSARARLLKILNGLVPGLVASVMKFGGRMLPLPGQGGKDFRTGWESRTGIPEFLTRTADKAILRNNQVTGAIQRKEELS